MHTMEHYPVIKRNQLDTLNNSDESLENYSEGKRNQSQKVAYCLNSWIWLSQNNGVTEMVNRLVAVGV